MTEAVAKEGFLLKADSRLQQNDKKKFRVSTGFQVFSG